jgi:hypothetical protein
MVIGLNEIAIILLGLYIIGAMVYFAINADE